MKTFNKKCVGTLRGWLGKLNRKASKSDMFLDKDSDLPLFDDGKMSYRLESLEPRILLSADPILGELARLIDHDSNNSDNVAAIIQEIDDAVETQHNAGDDQKNNSDTPVDEETPEIVWPTDWEDSETHIDDFENSDYSESGNPDDSDNDDRLENSPSVTTNRFQENTQSSRSDQSQNDNEADEVVGKMTISQSDVVTDSSADEDSDARVPPPVYENEISTAAKITVPVDMSNDDINNPNNDLQPGSDLDNTVARGPPATNNDATTGSYLLSDGSSVTNETKNTLTSEQLNTLFQTAIKRWSQQPLSQDQLDRLNNITLEITDLSEGILGETQGSVIFIDNTADGFGWFVDANPEDSVEFIYNSGENQFAAADGSDADYSIDLLTVLLHEIGHVLGYTHDAQFAIMDADLAIGQRVTLDDADGINLSNANAESISASLSLDLSLAIATNLVAGITITLNDNGLVDVVGSDSDQTGLVDITDITGSAGVDRLVIETGNTTDITFNGGDGADAIINKSGTTGTVTETFVETIIDRPLLFIPGFGGTHAADATSVGIDEWYLTRGISPDKLVLEPLANSYSDFIQSLANVGYVNGTNQSGIDGTLYEVLWDWRVTVADTTDATGDGNLSDITKTSLKDYATDSFDSGVDYFAYWLDKASTAWENLTGDTPGEVDVITHSTGGLVAKSYIQSAAYTDATKVASDHLPTINTLIQSGVPNQGTGSVYSMLNNDFSLKSASRLLGVTIDTAYKLLQSGSDITNPDGSTITNTSLPGELDFIDQYVATFSDLLAVYDFVDNGSDTNFSVLLFAGILIPIIFLNRVLYRNLNYRSIELLQSGNFPDESLLDTFNIFLPKPSMSLKDG